MAGPGRAGGYLTALSAALLLWACTDVALCKDDDDDWDPRKLYCDPAKDNTTIYDYPVRIGISNQLLDWNHYRGSVVMVINVASFWGYTWQYPGLNALQEKYRDQDFKIIAFPCNQFMYQEPGSPEEIMNCLRYVRPGGDLIPAFNLTVTIDVNGPREHRCYTHLKSLCPSPTTVFAEKSLLMYDIFRVSDIRWNFEKILLDRDGHPVIRYSSAVEPEDIEEDIERLLNQSDKCKH
jgi:glutathione peroxidase